MINRLHRYRGSLDEHCLEAALAYAERGWRVLPVLPFSPRAANQSPVGGLDLWDATINQETIREWWRWMPHANIGLATGRISGLIVLEAFPEGGGLEALEQLREEYGLFPVTRRAVSCRGRIQEYYKYPSGVVIPSRTWLRRGVNVIAEDDWVIAPPSKDPFSCRYEWELGGTGDLAEVQPFPDELLPEVVPAEKEDLPKNDIAERA